MDLSVFLTIIGFPFAFYCGWYFSTRKKKQFQKRDELEAEENYLNNIRKKPIELIRHAFSKLFLIIFLLVLSQFIPVFFQFLNLSQKFTMSQEVINTIQFFIFFVCTGVAFWTYRIFSNVVHYELAISKIKGKLEKINKKIERS